jgi:hypothetical protein
MVHPTAKKIFVVTNSATASPVQIFNHELFHLISAPHEDLLPALAKTTIMAGMQKQLTAVQYAYIKQYGVEYFLRRAGISQESWNSSGGDPMTGQKFINYVNDEIFADAFAGIDAYGSTASEFTQIVREALIENGATDKIGLKTVEDLNQFAWSKEDTTNPNIDSCGLSLSKGMAEFMAESKMRVGGAPGHVTSDAPLMRMYRATRARLESTKAWSYDGLTFYSDRVQVCLTYMGEYRKARDAKYVKRVTKLQQQIAAAYGDPGLKAELKRQIKEEYLKYQQYDPNIKRPNRYHSPFPEKPVTYEDAVQYLVKSGDIRSKADIEQITSTNPYGSASYVYRGRWSGGKEEGLLSQFSVVDRARALWDTYERKVIYEEFLNLTHPYVVDCKGKFYHSVDNPHGHRLREIARWAKSTGNYDGAIFVNVIDLLSTDLSTLPGTPPLSSRLPLKMVRQSPRQTRPRPRTSAAPIVQKTALTGSSIRDILERYQPQPRSF